MFDAYRVFYGQRSDPAAAASFLRDRFSARDSHIFVAPHRDSCERLAGFVQLYPSFSSVRLGRVYILNDLFVDPEVRRGGMGRALMEAAHRFARAQGAVRVSLETATSNAMAQRLYESLGYQRDSEFFRYHYQIVPSGGR